MNGFNPMFDYQRNQLMAQQAMIQNQLNQMNQMQPPQAQFNPYPQNNQPQFFVRQVGSIEEAKGFPVDPNAMYFFLDTGNGKIYMKQLNMNNGKSEFFAYNLEENIQENKIDPMQEINSRLTNIEKIIGELVNDKSISNDEINAESNGIHTESDAGKVQESESADVQSGSANDKRKK